MEEISQEELTAVRQFIHVFRAAGKMEQALTTVVSQQEQIGILDGKFKAAEKRALDAESRAVAKESEVTRTLATAEARLSEQRRQHEAIRAGMRNDAEVESKSLEAALTSKKQELAAQIGEAQKDHNAKLAVLRQGEAEVQGRINALKVDEKELSESVKALEKRKAELQDEFGVLFKKK